MHAATYPPTDKPVTDDTAVSDVVILAAGEGKRMLSAAPKALHLLAGRPLLEHVLRGATGSFPRAKIHVVVSPAMQDIPSSCDYAREVNWVQQAKQSGTAHAVAQALSALDPRGCALILYVDVPMVQPATLGALCRLAGPKRMALLSTRNSEPFGYGRIVRDADDAVHKIVEEVDASEDEKKITEINTGIMVVPVPLLSSQLPNISRDNAQKEQYLTDLVALARKQQYAVHVHEVDNLHEAFGINSRTQLAEAERLFQLHQARQLAAQGVGFRDLSRFDLRGSLRAGRDVMIDVGVVLEGDNDLGDGVQLGAYCVLKNVHIEAGSVIKPHSVLEDARVGRNCEVGPYARLRPGARLQEAARVGNFVEVKASTVGARAKINHLSYVGDSEVGEDVNVGAGVITCNYDGKDKHKTRLGKGAFVGSNASLVAPISVGAGATVAAGSAISKDVPDKALAIERSDQNIRPNWRRKK